jgi:hypothetical protein
MNNESNYTNYFNSARTLLRDNCNGLKSRVFPVNENTRTKIYNDLLGITESAV